MFDIGFSELVLIALLALLVLGPKRLPEVARTAGRWLGQLRRFMTDVKQDFDRELRTAELDELRKLKQELNDTRRLMEESSQQIFRDISNDLETSATIAPPAEATTTAATARETPAIEAPSAPPDSEPTGTETTPRPTRRRAASKKNGPARRTRR